MKILKRNLWNRIFHSKELKFQKNKFELCKNLIYSKPQLLMKIDSCILLYQVMHAHKKAWDIGFRNENLAPLSFGLFRTDNISTMSVSEVFLGGIYGLVTNNIPFWEEYKDVTMAGNGFGIPDDKPIYDIILNQYKTHLISNINSIAKKADKYVIDYRKIVYHLLIIL